VKKEIF